jgi:cyclomaltodextrinase / maltogenic alpha-amylase / neopullulanase
MLALKIRGIRWCGLVLSAWLSAAGCACADPTVTFSTDGGEAWTFEKTINAHVSADGCDEVAITSPVGTVVARTGAGRAVATVPLAPGPNAVDARCLHNGLLSGTAAQQHWLVRLRNGPKAWVRALGTEGGVTFDAGASEPAPVLTAPIASYEWSVRDGNPEPLAGLPAKGQNVVLPAPRLDGEYQVRLRIADKLGRSDETTVMFRVRDGRVEGIDPAIEHASWIDKAVVYGVVPALFGRRGLRDVTAQLDRLATLGIDTLWLSPVTASSPGDFGYAVTDHFSLTSRFGSTKDMHELVQAAHARGMRVVLDFVPNHVSDQHAYFSDTVNKARTSPYFDFFARAPNGDAQHYFDWRNLENLNYANPEVQRLIIEAFLYWVREFDVDGFRVDVAWGPRERAPEFWPRWRAELKRIKPNLFLLAEASAQDGYYARHGFDAAYDWTHKLGEWAWHDAFEDNAYTASRLRQAIAAERGDISVFRFLDNNDTGVRFATRHGPLRTRVATAMLFTLPGIPSLYTGQEVGASYEPYKTSDPIVWNDSTDLQSWHARLIALRRIHQALRSRGIRFLEVGWTDQVLAYVRPGVTTNEDIVVLLNFGAEPALIKLPQSALRIGSGGHLSDLLSGQHFVAEGEEFPIPLAGHGTLVLQAR